MYLALLEVLSLVAIKVVDNAATVLTAIKVDGKRLVDASVTPGGGETVVTGPAMSGTGTFVSTNGTRLRCLLITVTTSGFLTTTA